MERIKARLTLTLMRYLPCRLTSIVFHNFHPFQEQNGVPPAKIGKVYVVVEEKNEVWYLYFQNNLYNHIQEMEDLVEIADYFNTGMEDMVSDWFAVFIVHNNMICVVGWHGGRRGRRGQHEWGKYNQIDHVFTKVIWPNRNAALRTVALRRYYYYYHVYRLRQELALI